MGAGIRAEVSLPTSSPFDGVVDGSTPIYDITRLRIGTEPGVDVTAARGAERDRVVIEFVADAGLEVPGRVETVFDYGSKAAYRFETPCVNASPFAVLDRHGVPATETVIREGRLIVTFHASDLPTLRAVLEDLQATCTDMQVLRLLQSSSTPDGSDTVTFDRSDLTERQREVLAAAYDAGYFDHPKGANAGEVAETLGIDRSTFSEHIAAAQRKLLSAVLD